MKENLKSFEKISDTFYLMAETSVSIFLMLNFKNIADMWADILSEFNINNGILGIIGLLISVITIIIVWSIVVEVLYRIIELIVRGIYLIINPTNFVEKAICFLATSIKIIINSLIIIFIVSLISILFSLDDENELANKYFGKNVHRLSFEVMEQISSSKFISNMFNYKEVYNGVPISKAVESSQEIKLKAEHIVKGLKKDIDKAKSIYNWIGENINYDYSLAENLDSITYNEIYGAKYAFNNRSGVCFDYSTLFAAMMDDIGMRVKVIVGAAYDGKKFGPHAWNQVYLEDECRWIDVDTTFWGHEDSFDSDIFEETHITEKVAWEN